MGDLNVVGNVEIGDNSSSLTLKVNGQDIKGLADAALATAVANAVSIAGMSELLERNVSHMNPSGGYTAWPLLTDVTVVVHDVPGTSNLSRYRLPEFPVDGQVIDLFVATSNGALVLHTGAFLTNGITRIFHSNSVLQSPPYQCSLSGPFRYKAVYIEVTNVWLIL